MLRFILGHLAPSGPDAKLSVLIFHRVLAAPDPLFPGEIDASRFDAVCGWLREWFNVLPLDSAVQRLRRHELPARALSITFDDGYADNHDVALPILARHGLPATFFIATGFSHGGRMWNDTIIESVRHCTRDTLDLAAFGIEGLTQWPLTGPESRRRAAEDLLRIVKYLPTATRLHVTGRIADAAGARTHEPLMMTTTQIRALHEAGMQVGAHTVTHPILATLSDADARREIVGSKLSLEDTLQAPVTLFAYPNGRPGHDFTDRSVDLVRDAGFDAAVTTAKGIGHGATDVLRIPRFTPWDRSRARFGLRLAHNLWQGAGEARSA